MLDMVGFGSLNVDYFFETEDLSFLKPFFPEGGYRRQWSLDDPLLLEDLKALMKKKARFLGKSAGGSAANAVYCLAQMGFRSGLLGKIGRDEEAEFLLEENRIIPFRHIAHNEKTGVSLVILEPSRDRTIIRIPNANRTLSWADVDPGFLRSFSILHLTSLPGDGLRLQLQVVEELLGEIQISFDPGETYVRKGLAALIPLLACCDWLFITEGELETLTGYPLNRAALEVQTLGVKTLIVKRKGAGAKIIKGAESWDLAAEKVRAVDTTGAGDVFAAGFLAGVLKGCPVPDCGRLGLVLSRKSLMELGRGAYPGKKDFETILSGFGVKG